MTISLPKHWDINTFKIFIAGAISILIIKLIITDFESFILNLFYSIGIESKILIAVMLSIIIYYLLKS